MHAEIWFAVDVVKYNNNNNAVVVIVRAEVFCDPRGFQEK
jgi:hypothetical protein